MKRVTQTLSVARSNVLERRDGARPARGPQERPGDVELAAAIRRLVDTRPTYGYRRIAALLKRERRSEGLAPVNTKRLYRLMKKHGLLLERHTGRRRPREHDGQVATIRSNCRWCSDVLEFTCWNGEVVRVAFALDCHDREVISWVATNSGISGEMIRDMMVRCVEQRFGGIRAPHPVQWLSDNGSIFAAHRTVEIALALNLVPCFTPVESPESNGMAEAFVNERTRGLTGRCVRGVGPVRLYRGALPPTSKQSNETLMAITHRELLNGYGPADGREQVRAALARNGQNWREGLY